MLNTSHFAKGITTHAHPKKLAFLLLTASVVVMLTGCSTARSDTSEADAAPASDVIVLENGWVKAADSGMSAAFGELENTGKSEVTVVSVATDASDAVELHETVENEAGEMVMREKGGGFVIDAGSSLLLAPGGNHIMLMDLTRPMNAGDEITFTLAFSDGSTTQFTVPAKDYAGANENYEDADEMEMGGHAE